MNIGEKIGKAIKKIKNKLIVSFILWLILVVVFVAPLANSIHEGMLVGNLGINGGAAWEAFFAGIAKYIVNPFLALGQALSGSTDGMFFSVLWKFTLVYIFAVTIGIILAEKEYLPTDKRGNVNVLVVGRFRCW